MHDHPYLEIVMRPREGKKSLLHLSLPVHLRERLDNMLYDPLERKIPAGAYSKFFIERLEEYANWDMIPLEQFGFEETDFIAGPKNTILKLEAMFNKALERNS
jgi:hypothetical protein